MGMEGQRRKIKDLESKGVETKRRRKERRWGYREHNDCMAGDEENAGKSTKEGRAHE